MRHGNQRAPGRGLGLRQFCSGRQRPRPTRHHKRRWVSIYVWRNQRAETPPGVMSAFRSQKATHAAHPFGRTSEFRSSFLIDSSTKWDQYTYERFGNIRNA
jgi:hypothetical protein